MHRRRDGLQEYCCQFLSGGKQWISPELLENNIHAEASCGYPSGLPDSLYAGWDVSRYHDLSVIWFLEMVGDITRTRGIIFMKNVPTPDQIKEMRGLMSRVRRLEVDASGMGLAIYEALAREFPYKVEDVTFTAAKKEAMSVLAKSRLRKICVQTGCACGLMSGKSPTGTASRRRSRRAGGSST
jgi:phage FluMu gp28-like protein